jgi:predicted DNA-binding protein
MTPEQWRASERHINQVEDDSFAFRHRERMSHAQATELSTRNNPTSVTTNSTSLWIW